MASNDDEEYKFNDEEQELDAYKPNKPSIDVSDTKQKRKKWFIIIGAIIALFCLYKLFGLFSASPKTDAVPAAPQVAPVTTTPPSTQTPATTTAETGSTLADLKKDIKEIEGKSRTTDMEDELATLQESVTQQSENMQDLQDQVSGLSTAISTMQNNIATLTQQVNTLTTQIKTQPQIPAVNTAVQPGKPVKRARAIRPKPVSFTQYYVKAVIQGRAWLTTAEGATLTVSVGDNLPGYGQIVNIDSDQGVVLTSSGKVINYMSQDR